jgi:hypothetical protein
LTADPTVGHQLTLVPSFDLGLSVSKNFFAFRNEFRVTEEELERFLDLPSDFRRNVVGIDRVQIFQDENWEETVQKLESAVFAAKTFGNGLEFVFRDHLPSKQIVRFLGLVFIHVLGIGKTIPHSIQRPRVIGAGTGMEHDIPSRVGESGEWTTDRLKDFYIQKMSTRRQL